MKVIGPIIRSLEDLSSLPSKLQKNGTATAIPFGYNQHYLNCGRCVSVETIGIQTIRAGSKANYRNHNWILYKISDEVASS